MGIRAGTGINRFFRKSPGSAWTGLKAITSLGGRSISGPSAAPGQKPHGWVWVAGHSGRVGRGQIQTEGLLEGAVVRKGYDTGIVFVGPGDEQVVSRTRRTEDFMQNILQARRGEGELLNSNFSLEAAKERRVLRQQTIMKNPLVISRPNRPDRRLLEAVWIRSCPWPVKVAVIEPPLPSEWLDRR
jgi:hypothetical protein